MLGQDRCAGLRNMQSVSKGKGNHLLAVNLKLTTKHFSKLKFMSFSFVFIKYLTFLLLVLRNNHIIYKHLQKLKIKDLEKNSWNAKNNIPSEMSLTFFFIFEIRWNLTELWALNVETIGKKMGWENGSLKGTRPVQEMLIKTNCSANVWNIECCHFSFRLIKRSKNFQYSAAETISWRFGGPDSVFG